MVSQVNGPIPIKRKRRTKADMDEIGLQIYNVLLRDQPMTVRQVFYRLVSAGVVPKTEAQYKSTVGRLVLEMRRAGDLPYSWIVDGTRWMRKPTTYSSLDEALYNTAATYRRDLWADSDVYVEVWTEKDAIAGILFEATDPYDVPLMVARGFSSETFLYTTGSQIEAQGKPTFIYQFGDHDPSGVAAASHIERKLREFAPGIELHFTRAAVTPEQIDEWDLPTRPTKRSDTRSKNFKGESVEVDAIPPADLRLLVEDCIEQHLDHRRLAVLRAYEDDERRLLYSIARRSA